MIDYKEVRIGNLVMYKEKEYKIEGISKDYPFLDTIEFGAGVVEWKDLEPIPLTGDKLIGMGFRKSMRKNNYTTYTKGYHRVAIYDGGSCSLRNHRHSFYYIHTLQNLYFALTNKEL